MKILKKSLLRKLIAIFAAWQFLASPVLVRVAYADEATPSETTLVSENVTYQESPSDSSTSDTSAQQQLEETSQGTSEITTGDASSTSEVKTVANSNQDTVAGEVTTPSGNCDLPEGETSCPGDITIENSDEASVSDSASSSATTGENEISSSSGDAVIESGDATASGQLENQVNVNTVTLEPNPSPDLELSAAEEATSSSEDKTLLVSNDNNAAVVNDADILAQTGDNLISESGGDDKITTGEALAWLNLFNLLNVNIVGSYFELLFLDILSAQSGDINLNEVWKQILEKSQADGIISSGDSSNLDLLVTNQNQADLENNVDLLSTSGGNEIEGGNDALIKTGDATALANVGNIVNTNILGSQFFFGVINILNSFGGDLILPRPENFMPQESQSQSQESAVFENRNEAKIADNVLSSADTGGNVESGTLGDNTITTGDANALTTTFSLVNLNIFRTNWFFFLINNLGNWRGMVYSWPDPSGKTDPVLGSQVYQLGLDTQTQASASSQNLDEEPSLIFQNNNSASVRNNINVLSETGGNQISQNRGDASIDTGNARSIANLFNLVNLNILGGRWFFGLVNVLGDWSGNAVFAYPDLAVEVTPQAEKVAPGETFDYSLSFINKGYDDAVGARVSLNLPEGIVFIGDDGSYESSSYGRTVSWQLGNVAPGESGRFNIKVKVDPNFNFEEPLSWFPKLIPEAKAAEEGKKKSVVVYAEISAFDPEPDTNNNSSSAQTLVYQPVTLPASNSVDTRKPVIEISAKNNVNGFVYHGDTITFEIKIKNVSDVPSYNTKLVQKLYNTVPGDFGAAEFDLGTLEPGKSGTLTFGMKLAGDDLLPAGHFHTIAQVFGNAPDGSEVSSNVARTDFDIREKEQSSVAPFDVMAKEGEVLGVNTNACPKPKEDILPYVFLLIVSTLYLSRWSKARLKTDEK
jgi:hypothetical protein